MIHNDTMKTSRTVPGHMVINVFRTNRVLKLMRLRAPIDLDEASVNSLLLNETVKDSVSESVEHYSYFRPAALVDIVRLKCQHKLLASVGRGK